MPCDVPLIVSESNLPEIDHEPYDKDRAVGVKVINLTKVSLELLFVTLNYNITNPIIMNFY